MRKAIQLSAALLFVVSMTSWLPPHWLWMWMSQVVATEYGHLGALACLVVAGFTLVHEMRVVLVAVAIAFVVFLQPVFQYQRTMMATDTLLRASFGEETGDKVPTYTTGWIAPAYRFRMQRPEAVYYKDDPEAKLRMEVFRAQNTLSKKVPWILMVPGGAWKSANASEFWELNVELAKLGYAVISIEYRVLNKWHWPTPREDVATAVDYVKARAESWGLDPDQWVIVGRSAGAQLGGSYAYELKPAGLKGAIFFYGPADMNLSERLSKPDDLLKTKFLLRDFLGKHQDVTPDDFNPLSPIRFVSKESPPTLILHGARDTMVWNMHSRMLSDKLNQNGVANTYIELPWATHGFDYASGGPGWQVSNYAIKRFLAKVMPAEKTVE